MYKSAPKKRYIKEISIGVIAFLLVLTIVFVVLSRSSKVALDIERLSSLEMLRSDLEIFFNNNNFYPDSIMLAGSVKDPTKCRTNLCLTNLAKDPKTGQPFHYAPCDTFSDECAQGVKNANSYIINYFTQSNISLPSGLHFATPQKLCADSECAL